MSHMPTIQVVIDKALLEAVDAAAREARKNRSAIIRESLREHLTRARVQELERRDRAGYERHPDTADEFAPWEQAAAWPEE